MDRNRFSTAVDYSDSEAWANVRSIARDMDAAVDGIFDSVSDEDVHAASRAVGRMEDLMYELRLEMTELRG